MCCTQRGLPAPTFRLLIRHGGRYNIHLNQLHYCVELYCFKRINKQLIATHRRASESLPKGQDRPHTEIARSRSPSLARPITKRMKTMKIITKQFVGSSAADTNKISKLGLHARRRCSAVQAHRCSSDCIGVYIHCIFCKFQILRRACSTTCNGSCSGWPRDSTQLQAAATNSNTQAAFIVQQRELSVHLPLLRSL